MTTEVIFTLEQQKILNDPTASFWLKKAVQQMADRDPVDALHDAEELVILLRARWNEIKGASLAGR